MQEFLRRALVERYNINDDGLFYEYREDVNADANSNAWLENGTSYIYKVATLCAIDSDKCDYVYMAIGVQREHYAPQELKATFYFDEGENDDIGRVLNRALKLIQISHPAFELR